MSGDFELWTWALDVYARAGVSELCLRLQYAHGLYVGVVLACVWAGTTGRSLRADDVARLARVADPARGRVEAIRGLRAEVAADRDDADQAALYETLGDA